MAPRMISHMITSEPSLPPSFAYSAMVIFVSPSGSFSRRSMNSMSQGVLLKPARSPWIWCERPPVPTMATLMSSGKLRIALRSARPRS